MTYHFRSGQWDDACALVKRHHYSKRVPSNVQFVGSLHADGGLFGDSGEIVAAVFFTIPANQWSEKVIELARLVRGDVAVPLSHLISKSCDFLRGKGERLIVSYADKSQGHFGGVYQASGWRYSGENKPAIDGVIVDGEFIHGRTAHHKWGTRSPSRLAEKGIEAVPHYDEGKHLYWRALGVAGKTRAKRLGLQSLPYPTSANGPEDEQVTNLCEPGVTPGVRSNIGATP